MAVPPPRNTLPNFLAHHRNVFDVQCALHPLCSGGRAKPNFCAGEPMQPMAWHYPTMGKLWIDKCCNHWTPSNSNNAPTTRSRCLRNKIAQRELVEAPHGQTVHALLRPLPVTGTPRALPFWDSNLMSNCRLLKAILQISLWICAPAAKQCGFHSSTMGLTGMVPTESILYFHRSHHGLGMRAGPSPFVDIGYLEHITNIHHIFCSVLFVFIKAELIAKFYGFKHMGLTINGSTY